MNFITSTCYIVLLYHEKCKIMYTDSLIYYIEYSDVYDIMKRDIAKFEDYRGKSVAGTFYKYELHRAIHSDI